MDRDTWHPIGVNEGTTFKVMGLLIRNWSRVYRQGMERISAVGKRVNIDGYRHNLIIGIANKCGRTHILIIRYGIRYGAVWIHANQSCLTAGISDWTGRRINGKDSDVVLKRAWLIRNCDNTTNSVAAIFVHNNLTCDISNHSDMRRTERTDIVDVINGE